MRHGSRRGGELKDVGCDGSGTVVGMANLNPQQ
jgi:hypothetical protein